MVVDREMMVKVSYSALSRAIDLATWIEEQPQNSKQMWSTARQVRIFIASLIPQDEFGRW